MKTASNLLECLSVFGITPFAKEKKASPYFQPPEVIRTVEPSYPPNTVAGGTVVLKVTVSPSGELEDVRAAKEARGFT